MGIPSEAAAKGAFPSSNYDFEDATLKECQDLAKMSTCNTPPCILVVDDDQVIVWIIQRALTKRGFEVVTASTGEEGIERAHQLPPDLVVLDIMLPGLDGYAICRMLKTDPLTSAAKIILLSARGTPEEMVAESAARKAVEGAGETAVGADGYLTKPVSVKDLVDNVEQLLKVRQV